MNVAMSSNGSCRWRSPLLALLWKEWRQQRWVFLPLLFILPLPFLVLLFTSGDPDSGLAIPYLFVVAVLIGSNAFCAEQDDDTEDFLKSLPVRSSTLFGLKCASAMVMVYVAMVAIVLLFLVASIRMQARVRPPAWPTLDSTYSDPVLVVITVATWSLLPAIVSVLARRTVVCIVATAAAAILMIWWLIWVSQTVVRISRLSGTPAIGLEIAGSPYLIFVLTLASASWFWCWSWRRRPFSSRILRVGLLIVAFVALTGWPLALQCLS